MARSIGNLRHHVEIQSPVNTTDTGGGAEKTWSTQNVVWASLKPIKGVETYRQGQVQETLSHELYIRYTADIGTNYRVKYGTRTFNIRHIRNIDERDRYLLLMCDEGVAA